METVYDKPYKIFGIILSFTVAIILNVYPLSVGMAPLRPMFIMMVLIFWLIFQPQLIGLFFAFFIGLIADMLLDTVLGQQAFCSVLMALVIRISSLYIRQINQTNAWFLACLCLLTFQCSLWALQLFSQNIFVSASAISLLMSMLSWPIIMWFLGRFVK
ncbi:MAG: rod shape-determining protein MreD [Gammaproteobacteria bacterium]|nr:MAG: rod shape-determining protein MreD [Gammaproteobacteria bacterium]